MADNQTPGRGCPIWIKVLLILSLAANIAVVGIYLGHQMQEKDDQRGNRAVSWIIKLMPEDRRDFVRKAFDARRDELRSARADRNRQMQAILAAVRAEPFSPETLEAEIRKRSETKAEREDIIQSTLIEVLTALTEPERTAFADNLEAKLRETAERRRARD